MKSKHKLFFTLVVLMLACQDDSPLLDMTLDKSGIFSTVKNSADDVVDIQHYVTKSLWTASSMDEQDPNFNHGDQTALLTITSAKKWKLDTEVPFNWTDINGNFLNNWTNRADMMAAEWPSYGDDEISGIDNASLEFKTDGTVVLAQDDGGTMSGRYTIDEQANMISFSGITPSIDIGGWAVATTTSKNKWKIVVVETNPLGGAATGIWLGKRDESSKPKAEYMVFHFKLQ